MSPGVQPCGVNRSALVSPSCYLRTSTLFERVHQVRSRRSGGCDVIEWSNRSANDLKIISENDHLVPFFFSLMTFSCFILREAPVESSQHLFGCSLLNISEVSTGCWRKEISLQRLHHRKYWVMLQLNLSKGKDFLLRWISLWPRLSPSWTSDCETVQRKCKCKCLSRLSAVWDLESVWLEACVGQRASSQSSPVNYFWNQYDALTSRDLKVIKLKFNSREYKLTQWGSVITAEEMTN